MSVDIRTSPPPTLSPAAPSANAIRLTIDIARDPEHPTAWVATCQELGVTSAARTPHGALAALGVAVKTVVNLTLDGRSTSGNGLEVLHEIAAGYAVQRRPDAADTSPHSFAPHPNGESRLCATCGKPYNSNVHHEDDVSVSMSVEHAAMTWAVARRHRVAAAEALAAVNVAPGHPDNSSELEAWKAWERLELQLSDQLYQVCCAAVAGGRQ